MFQPFGNDTDGNQIDDNIFISFIIIMGKNQIGH